MVDVGAKPASARTATARGRIYIPQVAYDLIAKAPSRPSPPGAAAPAGGLEHAKEKARAKGDVLTVAQLAAVMGCKRTADLIPLCHPLQLSHVAVELVLEARAEEKRGVAAVVDDVTSFSSEKEGANGAQETIEGKGESGFCETPSGRTWPPSRYSVLCVATVKCEGKTGVEMEALTAVSVGLLTVWDMLKAVAGKEMVIGDVFVSHKAGGKSGEFVRTTG
jgi:molybdenum cofactor biosynthesis enzyme